MGCSAPFEWHTFYWLWPTGGWKRGWLVVFVGKPIFVACRCFFFASSWLRQQKDHCLSAQWATSLKSIIKDRMFSKFLLRDFSLQLYETLWLPLRLTNWWWCFSYGAIYLEHSISNGVQQFWDGRPWNQRRWCFCHVGPCWTRQIFRIDRASDTNNIVQSLPPRWYHGTVFSVSVFQNCLKKHLNL